MAANTSTHQYESIRTPQGWQTDEKKLIMQITDTFDDIYRRFGRLRFEDLGEALQTRIVSSETITLAVSENKLWVAANLGDLAVQMAAEGVTLAEDARWLDTTTHLIKYWNGTAWVPVQADELHTSYIDIASADITIASGGTINIGSGGALNIGAGGALALSGAEVSIDTDVFTITNGTDEMLNLYPGGMTVGAGSVAANYFVGNVVNTTSMAGVTVDGSIQAVLDNLPKYLENALTITVPAATYNENVIILGFVGNELYLHFESGAIINGTILITGCTSRITLYADAVDTVWITGPTSNLDYTVAIVNAPVTLDCLNISGNISRTSAADGTSVGVLCQSARLNMTDCTVERTDDYAIYCGTSTVACLDDVKGGVAGADATTKANLGYSEGVYNGSVVHVNGASPLSVSGNVASIGTSTGAPTPTASTGAVDPTAVPTVVAIASKGAYLLSTLYNSSGSFGTYPFVVQGYHDSRCNYGLWVFDALPSYSTIVNGTAVVTVWRHQVIGEPGPVTIYLCYHSQTAIPSGTFTVAEADVLFTECGVTATIAKGGSAAIRLPDDIVALVKDGTIKGFGVYAKGRTTDSEDYYTALLLNCLFEYSVT